MSDAMNSGSGYPMTGPMSAMPAEPAGTPGPPVARHGAAALPPEGPPVADTGAYPRAGAVPVAEPVAPGPGMGTGMGAPVTTMGTPMTAGAPMAAEPVAVGAVPGAGILGVGFLTLVLGAWAGISVFVGPVFGWDPQGSGSWTWNLARAVLHAAPGIAGVLAGLLMMSAVGRASIGRARSEALLGGMIAVVAGAWLVIGPSAWPLFNSGEPALSGTGGLIGFSYIVGANIGAGVLMATLGGMAVAWGLRTERTRALVV